MATTSPDNLISPDNGDPYNLIPDWAASMASVQNALVNRAAKIGTTTERNAFESQAQAGTLWVDTTDGSIYIHTGTEWDEAVAPDLPQPVQFVNAISNHVISSTTTNASVTGTTASQSITLPRAAWVLVTLGAWIGATSAEVRGGINIGGSTAIPANSPTWGQVFRVTSGNSGDVRVSKLVRLNAGLNTATISAWKTASSGSATISYMMLDLTPLRWAV